jgi:hypothetical protein
VGIPNGAERRAANKIIAMVAAAAPTTSSNRRLFGRTAPNATLAPMMKMNMPPARTIGNEVAHDEELKPASIDSAAQNHSPQRHRGGSPFQ